MKRKEFVRIVTLGAGLVAVAGCMGACMNKSSKVKEPPKSGKVVKDGKVVGFYIDLNNPRYSDLETPGAYGYFKKFIIVRTEGGELIALDKRCTHQGARLSYNHSKGVFKCPRHGSVFSQAGEVRKGPAKVNLKSYKVQEIDKKATILTT